MRNRPLTVSDLLAVSHYTRDQMRGLLDALPAYASRDAKVRIARQYTAHDLLVIAACSFLEARYGLQRSAVAGFSEQLGSVLSGPRPVSSSPYLLLTFAPLEVLYVESLEEIQEGLLVPLHPIFLAVDSYLMPEQAHGSWNQRVLGFGPRAIEAQQTIEIERGQMGNTPSPRTARRSL